MDSDESLKLRCGCVGFVLRLAEFCNLSLAFILLEIFLEKFLFLFQLHGAR